MREMTSAAYGSRPALDRRRARRRGITVPNVQIGCRIGWSPWRHWENSDTPVGGVRAASGWGAGVGCSGAVLVAVDGRRP